MEEYLVYEEKASRVELFIRIVYSLILGIILSLYGLVANIVICIQWILILILGKRVESLNNFVVGYSKYTIKVLGYCLLVTDERPSLSFDSFKVFLEK
ncbi:MAG: DUF4389 domain-containing protein [Methanobrevibacter sp.]|jgi:hypothetical protein|nr:DUF4389 domain-containing protein [Candidatus Methanovirga aequatorialis]